MYQLAYEKIRYYYYFGKAIPANIHPDGARILSAHLSLIHGSQSDNGHIRFGGALGSHPLLCLMQHGECTWCSIQCWYRQAVTHLSR